MRKALILLSVVALLSSRAYPAVSAEFDKQKNASVSLAAEFTTGKYGTDTRTDSIYSPLTVTWLATERIDISAEFAMLYQSSKSHAANYNHAAMSESVAAKTAARWGNASSGAGMMYESASGSLFTGEGQQSSSTAGFGDIILKIGAIAVFEDDYYPLVRPSVFIKFPTASKSDGFGTGEFDTGVGVELMKWFGSIRLTGEGFYTFQGRSDGLGLKNYSSYSAGIGYQLNDMFEPMLLIKGGEAASDFSGDLLELRQKLLISLTETTSIDLFVSRGIYRSSPDYGGGAAVIYSF